MAINPQFRLKEFGYEKSETAFAAFRFQDTFLPTLFAAVKNDEFVAAENGFYRKNFAVNRLIARFSAFIV